jgi:hypothetical protein
LAPNEVGAVGRFELPAPPSADGEAQRQARAAASTAEAVEAELATAKATKEAMEEAFDKNILKKANAAACARQISGDADDNSVDDHDADDGDCDDEVDDVSDDDHDADAVDSTNGKDLSDDDFSPSNNDADSKDSSDDGDGEIVGDFDDAVDKRNAYAKAQDVAFKEQRRKRNQDKLDSDARIASNAPSEADRKLLEQRNTHFRAEYARAVRERSERLEFEELVQDSYYDEDFAASDSFIREQKALHARATQMLHARAANGEDVRTVRASWEAFERYGCFGALDDAFFDPRNG